GAGQDRLHGGKWSGWFDIEFHTLMPVQVATGITDFVRTRSGERLALTQAMVKRRLLDDPRRSGIAVVLPGSSLKGALRSLVEALSRSCVLVVGGLTRSALPRHLTRCANPDNLCPACRLFGSQDYQGQVSIADASVPSGSRVIMGTPLLWAPARSQGRGLPSRYLERGRARGRKFYKHHRVASGPDPRVVIKQGVTIPTRITFTNLTSAELGLLVSALGCHPQYSFPIKLGAGKPIGMGSVEVNMQRVVLLSGSEGVQRAGRLGKAISKAECLEGEALKERLVEWTQQAEQEELLLTEQLEELAQIFERSSLNTPAPEGMY
ncbi:MAG TPA: hypothetical protein EYP19_15925, partial [Desulfobacterales bacterium]|nr:hypothetical protein [Desulfobacterales bacterium]